MRVPRCRTTRWRTPPAPASCSQRFLDAAVDARELAAVRAVQRAVLAIVDALIDGSRPPLEALDALAAREPAIYALEQRPDGSRCTRGCVRGVGQQARRCSSLRSASSASSSHRAFAAAPAGVRWCSTTSSLRRALARQRQCGLRERQRRHRGAEKIEVIRGGLMIARVWHGFTKPEHAGGESRQKLRLQV